MEERDILILGAGLAGLAAASRLGDRALVLEQHDRPGGLVRTENFDGYWFDHVIHILHFNDAETKAYILRLLGDKIASCPPVAWVECGAGTVRYPFQMHLGGLEAGVAVECLRDFAEVSFGQPSFVAADFEAMLLRTFGRGMCETFFFPYNRKVWKRPLDMLAPSGFQWNIARPKFDQVLRSILDPPAVFHAYNADGWYPRPPRDSSIKGMEILSRALAGEVKDLRLNHRVESIDLKKRTVTASHRGKNLKFRFREACIGTLPLPRMIAMCEPVNPDLLSACAHLTSNLVLTAALSIIGPRPEGHCHWRYYTDESLIFNRLVYPHEFDPGCVPVDGWALMAEITARAEAPLLPPQELLDRTIADIQRAGALPTDCRVIDSHLLIIDPAYVVFTLENRAVVERARRFLKENGVLPLGRYGRWEYSSMEQVMRDGFACAEALSVEREIKTG
jgi:protoporphyrinogen oxidase